MHGGHRWLACALSILAMLGAPGARAASGRITFSGAIVMPTCTAAVDVAQADGEAIASRTYACGGRSQGTDPSDASMYQLSVVRLDEAKAAGSPLLRYFVGYRASMSAADARMVTQTYE